MDKVLDNNNLPMLYTEVANKVAVIRQQAVIADADVAELYGVQTKEVNQAVRNNLDKFPEDYMFELNKSELRDLWSKILTTKVSRKSRSATKMFWKTQIVMSNSIRITS